MCIHSVWKTKRSSEIDGERELVGDGLRRSMGIAIKCERRGALRGLGVRMEIIAECLWEQLGTLDGEGYRESMCMIIFEIPSSKGCRN